MNYNEFANKVIESLAKIIEDLPSNRVYTYNPKVTTLVYFILKFTVRPRNEEQFEVIKKINDRVTFETDNLE